MKDMYSDMRHEINMYKNQLAAGSSASVRIEQRERAPALGPENDGWREGGGEEGRPCGSCSRHTLNPALIPLFPSPSRPNQGVEVKGFSHSPHALRMRVRRLNINAEASFDCTFLSCQGGSTIIGVPRLKHIILEV